MIFLAAGMFEGMRAAQEAELIERWHEFYLLAGTAAVTLVGLLFVSLSFHLEALLHETDTGLQAETFMTQAQAALEQHDYDRAQSLVEQARGQYGRLSTGRGTSELLATYDNLAQAGVQAAADLDRARQQSLRWADYPMARSAALAAGAAYARLGDADGLARTVGWYRDNEDWWGPIRSGEYRDYYEKHYGRALR